MELSDSINFLSFLAIILIAVIVSPKAKGMVRKVIDFLITAFMLLAGFCLIIIVIGLVLFLVIWAWKTLHEVFPSMWSFNQILGMLLGLVVIFFFLSALEYFKAHPELNNLKFHKRNLDFSSLKKDFFSEFKIAMIKVLARFLK